MLQHANNPSYNFKIPEPPSSITFRNQQRSAYDSVFTHLQQGHRRQLLNFPTGYGKTKTAAAICGAFRRTLFLVHQKNLLYQAVNAFKEAYPKASVGIIWQGQTDYTSDFVVGMIPSVVNRLEHIPRDAFDCVIVDEAHHAGSKVWIKVIEYFGYTLRLGLSATPERLDGVSLASIFDVVAYSVSVRQAVLEGALAKPLAKQVKTHVDITQVNTSGDDLNQKELGACINIDQRNQLIVNTYLQHARDRKTLVFSASIKHAQALAKIFIAAGVRADAVWGDDPMRDMKLADFKANRTEVLINASLLIEGYDDDTINAIFMATPTKSRIKYQQCIGRGLRWLIDKVNCLVVDFVDNVKKGKHQLVGLWDFFGKRMRTKKEKEDGEIELEIDQIADAMNSENAEQRFNELFGGTLDTSNLLEEVELLIPPPDSDAETWHIGARAWEKDPATPNQLERLKMAGFDVQEAVYTKGEASHLIDRMDASNAQKKLLLGYGFDVLNYPWTYQAASNTISEAKRSGRVPNWERIKRLTKPGTAPKYTPTKAPQKTSFKRSNP